MNICECSSNYFTESLFSVKYLQLFKLKLCVGPLKKEVQISTLNGETGRQLQPRPTLKA